MQTLSTQLSTVQKSQKQGPEITSAPSLNISQQTAPSRDNPSFHSHLVSIVLSGSVRASLGRIHESFPCNFVLYRGASTSKIAIWRNTRRLCDVRSLRGPIRLVVGDCRRVGHGWTAESYAKKWPIFIYDRSSFIAVPVYADMQICRFLPVLCGLPPRSAAHSSPCPPPQGPFPGSLGKRISLGHGPLCSFAPGENSRPRIRTLSLYTANNPGHTGPDALGFICKYYY